MDGFDYEMALSACADRDAAALRDIYDRDGAFLLGIALRIVKRREVADDVVHDAFLDIWKRAGSFDPKRGAGRAWIVSVVRHRAFKALRRTGREVSLDPAAGHEIQDEAPDAFAALALAQEGAALHRCLGELEPARRTVLLLAYVDGLSQAEISQRLATPLGTVKAWVRRSLLSLRRCLS